MLPGQCRYAERMAASETAPGNVDHKQQPANLPVPWWRRVSVKTGASVLLASAVTFATVGWWVNAYEEEVLRQQHTVDAHRISDVVVERLADRMMAGGGAATWASVRDEASRFVQTAGVSRIFVVANSGQIKVSTDRANQATMLDLAAGSEWLRVVNPIPARPACLTCHRTGGPVSDGVLRGSVIVDFNLTSLDRQASRQRTDILLTGAICGTALLGVIFWLFNYSVMNRVTNIVAAAGRLARGDLAARADVRSRDELGLLASRFNRMAAHVQHQVARLETANLESSLLYTLVVEVSRNIEISEVATIVIRVLAQELNPQRMAFFARTTHGYWVCATADGELITGEGHLEDVLTSPPGPVAAVLSGFDRNFAATVCQDRVARLAEDASAIQFAVPLLSDTQLLGVLVGRLGRHERRLVKEIVDNLGVALTLALENASHYTGAITDGLTQLRNKSYGLGRLDEAIHAVPRQELDLALAMIDIDHFKDINDIHGHPAGDQVLKEIADRIKRCLRKSDVPARFGGEEFIVILPQTHSAHLAEIGERLRSTVAETPIVVASAQVSISVTVSIGIAVCRRHVDTGDMLVSRADQALYRAKAAGRNRVEVDYDGPTAAGGPADVSR
jgi:diguanylate cyclase (GGDEF)-like protein